MSSDRHTAAPEAAPGSSRRARVVVVGDGAAAREDRIATEEPMELRIVAEEEGQRRAHALAVTMRTPGHDFELGAGFLLSEGVIQSASDVWRWVHCEDGEGDPRNVVEAHLRPGVDFEPERFRRNVYTSSSCGVCGKASIEAVYAVQPKSPAGDTHIPAEVVPTLPETLRDTQTVFAQTGGLHAAGLFSPQGDLIRLREDVGRHNALDKLIGSFLLEERVPLSDTVLLVSGRASFELVQKALVAGIPTLCAVGAPSSLAVEMATELGLTLIGFVKADRFNVYAGEERLALPGTSP